MNLEENILIIKHGALGDIIQAEGIMRSIHNHHPNNQIILLTSAQYKDIMLYCPYINEVIIDNRFSFWRMCAYIFLYQKLNKFNFNIVYDLQNSQRTFLYKKLILRKSKWITTNRKDNHISGLRGLIDMLQDNGVPCKGAINPNIKWLANDITHLLKYKNIAFHYILLLPGSSKYHKEKRWPFYQELASELLKLNYVVVSILGPDEKDLADKIPGHIMQDLNWRDLAGVIQKSMFVIGNDSGLSHIASCFNKLGFAIFGPTTSAIRSELSRGLFSVIIEKNLYDLKVNDVMSRILKLLK
ncbi:MAG: glycosyltransferase family 9 protein [Methylophilaceae bacterium]